MVLTQNQGKDWMNTMGIRYEEVLSTEIMSFLTTLEEALEPSSDHTNTTVAHLFFFSVKKGRCEIMTRH